MRYTKWKVGLNVEANFLKSLNTLVGVFRNLCEETRDNQQLYNEKMRQLQESKEYQHYIELAVRRMVTPLAVQNMATWRTAAKKASRNPLFYTNLMREVNEGLKQDIESQVHENAQLIKTLPTDVAEKVTKDIEQYTFEGLRSTEIAKKIKQYTTQHAKASAKLIARTEVSKTTTALTKARCDNLDLHWYVWRTVLDGDRVRKSHRNMEGVLVNWNVPPSPERLVGEKDVGNYHAGNIWNCRCYPEPLIELDDVTWPHRVYYEGKIQTMAKNKFEKIM